MRSPPPIRRTWRDRGEPADRPAEGQRTPHTRNHQGTGVRATLHRAGAIIDERHKGVSANSPVLQLWSRFAQSMVAAN